MSGILDYPELLECDEELIPLSKACKLFRPPISRPTIERRCRDSVREVVLRTVKVGGTRCTTQSEIKRYTRAQLPNPAPTDVSGNESTRKVTKHSIKTGGGMTAQEIVAGLARHGLEE